MEGSLGKVTNLRGGGERYQLEWPGKKRSIALGNTPTTNTLRPSADESTNFEVTRNLFIEGDNLDALKIIQRSYIGEIKMIYIDPPYNTGSDLIYHDDFSVSESDYLLSTNQKSSTGERLLVNPETSGRFHSSWLSMIYPRLRLARNLLAKDGVIAVHIDEHEYANLEKIMCEIFGESNNLGTIVWDKRNPKGNVTRVAQKHEYVVMFARDYLFFRDNVDFKQPKKNAHDMIEKASDFISKNGGVNSQARDEYRKWVGKCDNLTNGEKPYCQIDDDGNVYRPVSMASPSKKLTDERYFIPLVHPVTGKNCPVPENGWRNKPETMQNLLEAGEIVFGPDETTQPTRKYLLKDHMSESVSSILPFAGSDDKLFSQLDLTFDNPKPVQVVKKLISSVCKEDDIILDFFAGSSTCAHAVMQLNAEDGGCRRFIMIQIAQEISSSAKSDAPQFQTVADLSKERIRRAGDMILKGSYHGNWNRDVGFRVLKIDSSNMKDVYYRPDEIAQSDLLGLVDNVKDDRTVEDLLFQVLLDRGVDLALDIRSEVIQDKKVFFVDDGSLIACFDSGVDESLIKCIAESDRKPVYVVFRDGGFVTDSTRVNVEQVFKQVFPSAEIGIV